MACSFITSTGLWSLFPPQCALINQRAPPLLSAYLIFSPLSNTHKLPKGICKWHGANMHEGHSFWLAGVYEGRRSGISLTCLCASLRDVSDSGSLLVNTHKQNKTKKHCISIKAETQRGQTKAEHRLFNFLKRTWARPIHKVGIIVSVGLVHILPTAARQCLPLCKVKRGS